MVHFTDHDKRVKIKFDEYLRLHRSLSNLTPFRVYENMSAGTPLTSNPDFPDEFYEDVKKAEEKFDRTHKERINSVNTEYDRIISSLPENYTRKDFALKAQKAKIEGFVGKEAMSAIMMKENGQEDRLKNMIWEKMRPAGNLGFTSFFSR